MKYRLAKNVDCNNIAKLHYAIRSTYSIGIFAQLGLAFLKKYYHIILDDPNSIVVCAEDDKGIILGFCTATLDIGAQLANINKHKFQLGLAAIPSVVSKPNLIKHLIDRIKIINNDSTIKIISTNGARSDYWVWSATKQDSVSSVEMYFAQLSILKSLGVKELFGEVDLINKKILLFQKANGYKVIDQIILPDGRERVIMKLNLEKWEPKI